MKLNIKLDEKANVVKIGFAKELIEVYITKEESVKNVNWNTKDINSFLIKLSAATPDGEDIVVEADQNQENKVFKHIVDIFETFAKNYNNTTR